MNEKTKKELDQEQKEQRAIYIENKILSFDNENILEALKR